MRGSISPRSARITVLVWLLVLLVPALASAHSLAFGELRLVEGPPGRVAATLRLVGSSNPRALVPDLGPGCTARSPQWQRIDDAHVLHQAFDCGEAGLTGAAVGLTGTGSSEAQLVVRAVLADGRRREQTIRGDERVLLEGPESAARVLVRYVALGAEHIAGGFDHLLFVLGLVLLTIPRAGVSRGWRRLALTVTAFTLGHSVTLALVVLDLLRLRPAAVEAVIALSIVLLAVETVRPGADAGLTRRCPWLVAAAFGLLHGCGFAGALREVGLPPEALGPALVGFNLGVELGQLAFIAVLLLVMAGVARLMPVARRSGPALAYAMGGLAASWLLERLAGLG